MSTFRNVEWRPIPNSPRLLARSLSAGPGVKPGPFLCVNMAFIQYPLADMFCHIYRSNRKFDTYLYLVDKDDFSVIPADLLRIFGPPEFSFSFDLTAERSLAREDTREVLDNLDSQSYHLQLRDDILVEQMLALKALN